MKSEEVSYLVKGKKTTNPYEEVKVLIESQKILKDQKKEIKKLETRLRQQEKKTESWKKKCLNEKNIRLRQQLFPKRESKRDVAHHANTKHLNRILSNLKQEPVSKTFLSHLCCMNTDYCHDGLVFLIKLNLVKETKISGVSYYSKA